MTFQQAGLPRPGCEGAIPAAIVTPGLPRPGCETRNHVEMGNDKMRISGFRDRSAMFPE